MYCTADSLNTAKRSHQERGRNTPLFIVFPGPAGIYIVRWLRVPWLPKHAAFEASFFTQAGSRWDQWQRGHPPSKNPSDLPFRSKEQGCYVSSMSAP